MNIYQKLLKDKTKMSTKTPEEQFKEFITGKCQHLYTRNVASGNKTHYAKSTCLDCGKFVKWLPKGVPISTTLMVPFSEKDEAKALGAKWDPILKLWYAPTQEHLKFLSKWAK